MATMRNVPAHSIRLVSMLLAVGASAAKDGEERPRVREFQEPPTIRVLGTSARFRLEGGEGVEMWLDAETLGALALADAVACLPSSVVATRLPWPDIGSEGGPGALGAEWSPSERRLHVRMGSLPLITVQLPDGGTPSRILLRHLDRLALLVLRPTGGPAIWVWVGTLRFVMLVPDAEQYRLCEVDEARVGSQVVEKSALLQGLSVSRLDEAGDVIVIGRSPAGVPFHHRHRVCAADLEERLNRALGALSRTLKIEAAAGRFDR